MLFLLFFFFFFLLLSAITRIAILMLPLTGSTQKKLGSSVLPFRIKMCSGALPIGFCFVFTIRKIWQGPCKEEYMSFEDLVI